MSRVAVIGAGIAGLTCAFELQRAGMAVDVYERDANVGGRMSTRSKDGLAFDLGATFLNRSFFGIIELAHELGVPLRDVSPVSHVMYRGGAPCVRWSSVPCSDGSGWRWHNFGSFRDAFRFEGMTLWSRLKFLTFVLRMRCEHPATLPFYELSSVPAKLNTGDADTAARREVSDELAYIFDGYLSFMLLNRASDASKAIFRAIFSVAADPKLDLSPLNAVGSMQAIPDALARGLNVRRDCAVSRVQMGASGWEVTTPQSAEMYDRVVLATTAGAARKMLPEGPALQLVAQTRYTSTIMVAFRIPHQTLGRTQCFYVPLAESRIISGFTNESLKGDAICNGWSLVNVCLHEAAAVELMDAPDEEVFAKVKAELLKVNRELGRIPERVLAYDLQRWPEGIPKYDCAHISRVRQYHEKEQGRGGLYLCGDYMNGPWVEGASRSGKNVAMRMIE